MGKTKLHPADRDAAHLLILDLQALQSRAHRLGLPITARGINNAMNASGWEQAGNLDRADQATRGERYD